MTYVTCPSPNTSRGCSEPALNQDSARFVAALDASIACGELETDSQDLAQLLGRPATLLTELVGAANAALG